ncbi:MAG: DUF402 domain-containing protein [Lachnospiraceae bacterium]|nr:DUF402 domain-containing protein [Lachnospiraceae bacterium]
MTDPVLFRKRIIPEECILLKDDEILLFDPENKKLITKWHALKPKKDLHHGISAYFWDEGFKVSKFYDADGALLYWYCDIIDVCYPAENVINSKTGTVFGMLPEEQGHEAFLAVDLLADVIIYPDGTVKVVDIDELATAFEHDTLTSEQLCDGLRKLNRLLSLIYSGKFEKYQDYIDTFEY